jgi:hypothetical protein
MKGDDLEKLLMSHAEMVVCMPEGTPSPFTDNESGVCSVCGRGIIFRPEMPKDVPKVCLGCIGDMFTTETIN